MQELGILHTHCGAADWGTAPPPSPEVAREFDSGEGQMLSVWMEKGFGRCRVTKRGSGGEATRGTGVGFREEPRSSKRL